MTPNTFPAELRIDPICVAALRGFTVSGFHGTTIREIAAEAGLSVPGIYHHYESKSSILVALCEAAMESLLAASRRAVAAGSTALECFENLTSCLIQFHAEYRDIAFVSYSEIRSLPEAAREQHLQARRDEQALVTEVVERGVAEGFFTTAHPAEAARAISTLCLGVAQWYRPDGPMPLSEVIDIYLDICKDTVRLVR